ncbi:MAG: hypothetical protein HUJ73_02480 [Eubacterium sp.]|nr:hypothetical protein [Eubacterium sp.]
MSISSKIFNVVLGVAITLCGILLLCDPRGMHQYIMIILAVSLFVAGGKKLIYFIVLAKYMVGGWFIMARALITISLGVLALLSISWSLLYGFIYLQLAVAFEGGKFIYSALELRKMALRYWWFRMVVGIAIIVICIICACCIATLRRYVLTLFGINLITIGVVRISDLFMVLRPMSSQ